MDLIEEAIIESDADDLEEDIIKQFGKFGVNIGITKRRIVGSRIVFFLKTKGNTREAHIRHNAPEVQRKLKLPLFYVDKFNFTLCLIVSREQITYDHLPSVLTKLSHWAKREHIQLPYAVGYDVLGHLTAYDLAKFPHLLMAGSSNSGKSVGLKALITSIVCTKLPSQVNFVLVDVGTTDLMVFDGLPHLSCPVIRNRSVVAHALSALNTEMERRVELEHTEPIKFSRLPSIVLVIDEFHALFNGLSDKNTTKILSDTISGLLQRGRHAKIHLVLAAQNPTLQNMKVDLGNITARIAFKCAKKNFSETILGVEGAEKLSGMGELLLQCPQYNGLQQIHGVFITPSELQKVVEVIKSQRLPASQRGFQLEISDTALTEAPENLSSSLHHATALATYPSDEDRTFANAIKWALENDYISINSLMCNSGLKMGWNKAAKIVKRLEEIGLISQQEGKKPRRVIPPKTEDLSDELVEFMRLCGYSVEDLAHAFSERSKKR